MGKVAYGIDQAARACGTSVQLVTEAIRDGDLIARMAGSRVLITRLDLEQWMQGLPLHKSCPGSGLAFQSSERALSAVSLSA